MMTEIRIHGRGGQGVVVASEVLASALFKEGKFVQSFPSFGIERRGAPVTAFLRIDSRKIRLRCEVYRPDHLIVLDPTLAETEDITAGLRENGWIVINSNQEPEHLDFPSEFRVATVDANSIALKHNLGTKTAPIVNTAILGAFAKITGMVGIEALMEAVREGVPVSKEENAAAANEAYHEVKFKVG